MSQDVVADALNMIRNAAKAGKDTVKITRMSNLLIEILKIMKQEGAVKKYKINSKDKTVEISLGLLDNLLTHAIDICLVKQGEALLYGQGEHPTNNYHQHKLFRLVFRRICKDIRGKFLGWVWLHPTLQQSRHIQKNDPIPWPLTLAQGKCSGLIKRPLYNLGLTRMLIGL